MLVNLKNGEIICLAFANGKKHDFRLFKDSRVHIRPEIVLEADTGYQGLVRLHTNSLLPRPGSVFLRVLPELEFLRGSRCFDAGRMPVRRRDGTTWRSAASFGFGIQDMAHRTISNP